MSKVERIQEIILDHGWRYQDIGPIHYLCYCGRMFFVKVDWATHLAEEIEAETAPQGSETLSRLGMS